MKLYQHQELALNYMRFNDSFALFMEQGPQPYTSKVVTPTGYRNMGDLKVGDKVVGADGKPYEILGVFEKGIKDVYEITFADGTKAKSCKDHLWNIQSVSNRSKGKGFMTVPLHYLFDKPLRRTHNWKWFIPMCEPVEFDTISNLPIDPYLLGLLLGDGGLTKTIVFSNSDRFVLERLSNIVKRDYPTLVIKRKSKYDYRIVSSDGRNNPLLNDLRDLGLMGKKSSSKFIPKTYQLSSIDDRIKLLQGLFDTDGNIDRNVAGFEYITASKKLAEDVTFIVQSLGGTINFSEKIVKGETYYRAYVKFPKGIMPFTLPRKADLYNAEKANPTRSIRKIEKIGREYVRCIRVSNPTGLYLTDNFIVTHNTGKTLPTLCRILELYKQGEIENALIVSPKATMGAWYRDCELFNKEDRSLLENLITVINYDSVWRKGKGYDRQWDCIVLDESHKIKNRTSKRSAFLLKLSLQAKYRYILTGTPIGNGQLENIWAQYAFLKPKVVRGRVASEIFGTYRQFEDKYCILNQYWKPYRYLNVDELQDIIAEYSYRVTKEECLDLPERLPDEIYDIELKEPKLYRELHKHSTIEKMDILAENPLARMLRLRTICSGFLKDDDGEMHELKCEKLEVLKEFLDGWEKKLVIFCNFTKSIDNVSGLLKKLKIKHVILDGRQKDKQIWRKFQSDESIQVIICQYQSASEGVDLFAADTIIYYEPTLSSNTLEQSRDRIHRIGQKSKCSYIHFITKGTIEVAIYRALKGYNDFSEKLFTEYMQEYTRSYSGGR